MKKIHPTAIIEDGAEIGSDVEIGPYCQIGSEVQIGDGCVLKSHVILDGQTTIGEKNIFHPTSYIGGEPQDLKYSNEKSLVKIGSKNTFREGVSVHRGTIGGGGEIPDPNDPVKAYVVSDEITDQQDKDATIRRRATI